MATKDERAPPLERDWTPAYTLFLLFMANGLSVADRALLGIVVDPVKAELALSDTEISLVSGFAFVLFNLFVGIFIARWVDRGNRKRILVLGVALWSAATALTGMAQGFLSLATTRVLVGIGEATVFPVAISMIADLYIPARRPRSIGLYQSSTFVGVVLGSIAAGMLAALHGWRMMFVICGVSGFVLVLAMLPTMSEPRRTGWETAAERAHASYSLSASVAHLAHIPGFMLLALGVGVGSMAAGVLPIWAPAFLLRSHGVALADVGALIGPAVGLGGMAGTIVSGMLASRLARTRGSEVHGIWVALVAVPLSAPFFLLFAFAPSLTLTMAAAAVMNFLLASVFGPCVAAAVSLSPVTMRAVSSTLILATSSLVGAALAPLIVGMISDRLAPTLGDESLRYGLAAVAITPLLSWVILWRAYRQALAAGSAERL